MTERTAEQIQAEMEALKRELAAIELPHIESALNALSAPSTTALISTLTVARDSAPPSQATVQINNAITVLVAVPQFLTRAKAELDALLADPDEGEEPGEGEPDA